MSEPNTQADALLARCRRLLRDHRARAKKNGIVLDYGLADVRRLLESSPLCAYCRVPLSFSVQLDHRTPIAPGGRHVFDNLTVCCARCNQLKGQLEAAEFAEVLTFLRTLHPAARADLERRLLAGGVRYARGRRRR